MELDALDPSQSPPAKEPPSRLAGAALWLLVILGVGYMLYYAIGGMYVSGVRIANFPLPGGSDLELPGITYTSPGPPEQIFGPVALDPSMNHVGMLLVVKHEVLAPDEQLRFAMTVRDATGRMIWKDNRVLRRGGEGPQAGKAGHATMILFQMDVPSQGAYTFEPRFITKYPGVVESANLEIRHNVSGGSLAVIELSLGVALTACFLLARRMMSRGDADGLRRAA